MSLLTDADLEYISALGVPNKPGEDLVLWQDGTPSFTLKGHAFYKEACRRLGVPFRPVQSALDLDTLTDALVDANLDARDQSLRQRLAAARPGSPGRALLQATLNAPADELLGVVKRFKEAKEAGENVVLLPKRM